MQTAVDCNGGNSNNAHLRSAATTITTTASSGSSSTTIVEDGNDEIRSLDAAATTSRVILTTPPVDQPTLVLRERLQAVAATPSPSPTTTPMPAPAPSPSPSPSTISLNPIEAAIGGTVVAAAGGGGGGGVGGGGGGSNGEVPKTTKYNFNAGLTHKNGNAHLIDSVEYLGSNVEQMSVTPSPSPHASPSKKLTALAVAPNVAAAMKKIMNADVAATTNGAPPSPSLQSLLAPAPAPVPTPATSTTSKITNNNNNSNNSSSSSSSNSNSNSTTSSVIATPILARNGNASFMQDISGGGIGGGGAVGGRASIIECNEMLSTKLLPLPSKSASLNAYDDKYLIATADAAASPPTPAPAPAPSSLATASQCASLSPSPSSVSVSTSGSSAGSSLSLGLAGNSVTPGTASPSPKMSPSIDEQLLQWKDMPKYLQFNPYVLKGYRPLQTFRGCLFSLFYWHNETINILTHAIPIVYILAIVPGLMPWERGYRFLSFCHVFGSVAPWCGSFVYHLFMNIERGENVYYRLLKLDMVGIWVSQSFGALPLVVATTFCFTTKWKWLFIICYCLMSLWGLYKALTASSPWQRRLCFALPFTMRSILTCMRTMGVVGGNSVALSHVYLQDGVSVLGGAIGAMRIPEKWFPGLVDYYLNSHNIMHVLVVVAVYSMHKATIKDFEWMSATTCDPLANATSAAIANTLGANIEL